MILDPQQLGGIPAKCPISVYEILKWVNETMPPYTCKLYTISILGKCPHQRNGESWLS